MGLRRQPLLKVALEKGAMLLDQMSKERSLSSLGGFSNSRLCTKSSVSAFISEAMSCNIVDVKKKNRCSVPHGGADPALLTEPVS